MSSALLELCVFRPLFRNEVITFEAQIFQVFIP